MVNVRVVPLTVQLVGVSKDASVDGKTSLSTVIKIVSVVELRFVKVNTVVEPSPIKFSSSIFSRINLKDSSDEIIKKIKKAKTDADPITENIKDYENRPEAYNLLSIYSDLSDQKIETTINEFVGKDFSSLKIKLSEKLVETISPIGRNITKLMKDKKHLEDVLKKGKEKASIIAEENLKKIREIVGFV